MIPNLCTIALVRWGCSGLYARCKPGYCVPDRPWCCKNSRETFANCGCTNRVQFGHARSCRKPREALAPTVELTCRHALQAVLPSHVPKSQNHLCKVFCDMISVQIFV